MNLALRCEVSMTNTGDVALFPDKSFTLITLTSEDGNESNVSM